VKQIVTFGRPRQTYVSVKWKWSCLYT